MLKKISIILISIMIIIGMCEVVNAAELKTSLGIIQKASETKYLENDQGLISKTIVDSNPNKGEVTIELKIANTKKETTTTENADTEIFLVVDNSPSMDFVTSTGKTRKELVLNSATKLVESIFNASNNVKIGLIDFHGAQGGIWGESASINNARVRQNLTNDKKAVLSAIQSQLERKVVSGTNIESGLKTAQNNFSKKANNKILILLSDGIPNASNDGTDGDNDVKSKENIAIQKKTKQAILDVKSSGIYTIALLTGMSESDGNTDKSGNVYDDSTTEENLAAAERVFGTQDNPVADKYYLVKSANINDILNNDILKDVTNKIQNPINKVKIVDYFPEDITENFEFSYVGNPSIGTTSKAIDTEDNTITWDVGTLKGDETATLKYKLKIKDMKNTKLLNKTIATNEKVMLTYKDNSSKDYTVDLSSSPKIKLAEVEEEFKATVSYKESEGSVIVTITSNKKMNKLDGWTLSEDGKTLTKVYSNNTTEKIHLEDVDGKTKDIEVKITNIKQKKQDNKNTENKKSDGTTVKGKLPQTGVSMTIVIGIAAIVLIAVFMYKKCNRYKGIK